MTESSNKQKLKNSSIDYIVNVVKGTIGIVPIAGPLLAEIAGTLIPNQRIDRLTKFAEELSYRLMSVEESKLRTYLTNENFTDAVEESLRQAARSTSDERRSYIASLLANGIDNDKINFIEIKHLLRLLGEINDIEIIWLRSYMDPTLNADKEFRKRHAEILSSVTAHFGSTQEELDQEALQESYKLHLERLGLLRSKIRFDTKTKLPEFDKKDGFKKLGFEITPMGRLLIRYINAVDIP